MNNSERKSFRDEVESTDASGLKNSPAVGAGLSGEIGNVLLRLEQRLERIEEILVSPTDRRAFRQEWFAVPEAAKLLNKRPFTIREWCRLGRVNAQKRKCGRGRTSEWVISKEEIERYLNEGLLPQDH